MHNGIEWQEIFDGNNTKQKWFCQRWAWESEMVLGKTHFRNIVRWQKRGRLNVLVIVTKCEESRYDDFRWFLMWNTRVYNLQIRSHHPFLSRQTITNSSTTISLVSMFYLAYFNLAFSFPKRDYIRDIEDREKTSLDT